MWTIRLWLTPSVRKRTDYLRKKYIFANIGNNCIICADSLVNKYIPDGSVFAGIPAERISSIDEFISKRGKEPPYVGGVKPCKERVSEILISSLWSQFNERRQK